MTDILTPVGRLVAGHPMKMNKDMDDKTNQQKTFADGTLRFSSTIGIAIPKNGTTHWNQTPWGAAIQAQAVSEWPRGEHAARAFAWKITDGDSTEPNKRGNKPCDREGYPGHWVLFASSCFPTPTYHAGRYQPHEVIKDENEIKAGDYIRLSFNTKANGSKDSPGMYINPVLVELSRAGQLIVSASAPDAAAAFGGSAPVLPQGALIDTGVAPLAPTTPAPPAPTPSAPPPPAHDLVTPPAPPAPVEPSYLVNGVPYKRSALLAMPGWTEAHIAGLQQV